MTGENYAEALSVLHALTTHAANARCQWAGAGAFSGTKIVADAEVQIARIETMIAYALMGRRGRA